MKLKEIYQGWKNLILTKPDIESISKDRTEICNKCPNKENQLGLDVCGLCHCPLISKTRSLDSSCPDGKW